MVHAVLHRLAPRRPRHRPLPSDRRPSMWPAAPPCWCAAPPTWAPGSCWRWSTPGVGTARRARGHPVHPRWTRAGGRTVGAGGPTWLVGPDNGLLLPMAAAYGGVRLGHRPHRARPAPDHPTRRSRGPGDPGRRSTAATSSPRPPPTWSWAVDPGRSGPPSTPASLVHRCRPPRPRRRCPGRAGARQGPAVLTSVASIDRFGNVQLEAGGRALEPSLGLGPGAVLVDLAGGGRPVDTPARSRPGG